MGVGGWLRYALTGPETGDGLGQGLLTDLVWVRRFRRCRARPVTWLAPEQAHIDAWLGRSELSKLGDGLMAVAHVDGRDWRAVERIWHGWPDPPAYAFVVIESDGTIWAAADFDRWPETWTRNFERDSRQTGDME